MEEAAARRRYDEQHEDRGFHDGSWPTDRSKWVKEADAAHPYHYLDGVTILVAETDLYPDDRFLWPRDSGLSETPI